MISMLDPFYYYLRGARLCADLIRRFHFVIDDLVDEDQYLNKWLYSWCLMCHHVNKTADVAAFV